jgi:hypothetical protein
VRKVFIIMESEDHCIGTVQQVLDGRPALKGFNAELQTIIAAMMHDECFDDDAGSFSIEIR